MFRPMNIMEPWQVSTFSLLLTENQLRKETKYAYAKERQHGFGHDEGIQNSSFFHTKVYVERCVVAACLSSRLTVFGEITK